MSKKIAVTAQGIEQIMREAIGIGEKYESMKRAMEWWRERCRCFASKKSAYSDLTTYWKQRLHSAESSLAAMQQRAEEAETSAEDVASLLSTVSYIVTDGAISKPATEADYRQWVDALVMDTHSDRDAALARAERAEEALRHLINKSNRVTSAWRHHGEIPPEDIHALYDTQCAAEALEPSPPVDASRMGGDHSEDSLDMVGEHCDTCPDDPGTCDRAECPAWGKSEEARARILTREENRPLTNEEHAIVDAGYERGKRIMAEVKAEERERRLVELVKEAFLQGFDAKDNEISKPTSLESYSERAESAWECSESCAALVEMEQMS